MRAAKTICISWLILISLTLMCGCAIANTPVTTRVALLAPFEGRYREIGYNALYAARLAIDDSPNASLELLPIDDGGTAERASDRARALAFDPQVVGAVVLGYHAAEPETLAAFGNVPVLIVGDWSASTRSDTVVILSNSAINDQITVPPRFDVTEADALETPVIGGEVFALRSFARLREDLSGLTIVSSGSLPDEQFAQRYRQSDPFAPQPGLLAPMTYDAFQMMVMADHSSRSSLNATLQDTTYEGLNGSIHIVDGYWENAPIHYYRYENRQLTTADDIVE